MRAPRCVLMSGLPGSGKTQLARALAARGLARLCPDEEMFKLHGRYGYDFPRGQYKVRESPVLDALAVELRELLVAGKDVVFDHGFWTPEERHTWRTHVTQAGAVPVLVYFPVPHKVLWSRIQVRNRAVHTDPNSIEFSEEDLHRFAGRFHPPGDDEPHTVYDGCPKPCYPPYSSATHRSRRSDHGRAPRRGRYGPQTRTGPRRGPVGRDVGVWKPDPRSST